MTPAEAGKCERHHSTVDTHCVKGRWYLIILNLMYGVRIHCTDRLFAIPLGGRLLPQSEDAASCPPPPPKKNKILRKKNKTNENLRLS
jgi:hypothetical protein